VRSARGRREPRRSPERSGSRYETRWVVPRGTEGKTLRCKILTNNKRRKEKSRTHRRTKRTANLGMQGTARGPKAREHRVSERAPDVSTRLINNPSLQPLYLNTFRSWGRPCAHGRKKVSFAIAKKREKEVMSRGQLEVWKICTVNASMSSIPFLGKR